MEKDISIIHPVMDIIKYTQSLYLESHDNTNFLSIDYVKTIDHVGTHYICILKKEEDLSSSGEELLNVYHTYFTDEDDDDRIKKLFDEMYGKLINLMLKKL